MPAYFMSENILLRCDIEIILNIDCCVKLHVFLNVSFKTTSNKILVAVTLKKIECVLTSHSSTISNMKRKGLNHRKDPKLNSTVKINNTKSDSTRAVIVESSPKKCKKDGESSAVSLKLDTHSADAAFYCNSACLSDECFLSAQQTLDSMLNLGERYRKLSESSTVSNVSDLSNKDICSLNMNGVTNHLLTPNKVFVKSDSEMVNGSEELKPSIPILCHESPKKRSPTVRNIIKEETVSITCKSTNVSNSEEENVHNLRKRIRKKTCCNCDCSSSHTTVIVRRLTQIQHHTSPTKHCSSPVKSKLKSPSPEKAQTVHISNEYTVTETVTSSSSEKKPYRKQRSKEVDKLYADLREIVWAKNWARDNILSQSCNKRSFSSSPYSDSPKVSSTSKTIVKSSFKSFRAVNKDSPNIDKKCKRSLNFLSVKNKQNSSDTSLCGQSSYSNVSNGFAEMSSILDDNSHQDSCSSTVDNSDDGIINPLNVVNNESNNHIITDFSNGPLLLYDHGLYMDPLSVHTHDDISMTVGSFIEKEVIVNGGENSTDSDNSSFALDISPSSSGDETIGGNSEISSVIRDSTCNILSAESQSGYQHSNSQERKSSEVELPFSKSSSILELSNEDTFSFKQNTTTTEIVLSSVKSNLSNNENLASTESLNIPSENSEEFLLIPYNDIQAESAEENSVICTVINDELDNVPTECVIEEVTSTKPNELNASSDSFDLPILTASGPVVEIPFEGEASNPPSLEPCINISNNESYSQPYQVSQYDMVVFHNDINEIEVVIPNVDEVSSTCSAEDLYCDRKQVSEKTENIISKLTPESNMDNIEEKLPQTHSAKKSNFKSLRKQKNHCLTKKILQKYYKLSKMKSFSNQEHKSSHSIKRRKLKLRPNCNVTSNSFVNKDSVVVNNASNNIKTNTLITSDEDLPCKTVEELPVSVFNQSVSSKRDSEVAVREPGDIQETSASSDGSSSDVSDVESISEKRLNTFQEIRISTQISPIKQSTLSFMHHSSVYSKIHQKYHVLHFNKVTENRSQLQIMKNSTNELKRKAISSVSLSTPKRLKVDDSRTRCITFHYKFISVKKSDCFMKVIMKHTRGPNIFLSVQALTELTETLNCAMNDTNIRVLILRGSAVCFCSGVNLQPLIGDRRKEAAKELSEAIKNFVEALATFHKPLVSVVEGKAVGFGVTLLTFSDVILASNDATFNMPYSDLGYFPEGAGTVMLPRVVGPAIALDMMLRGRTLTAQEAKDCRLVSEVVDSKILTEGLISKVKCLEGSSLAAMESTKCMVRMNFYPSLQISLENEVEMLPKQWLSQACQKALQAADKKGLI